MIGKYLKPAFGFRLLGVKQRIAGFLSRADFHQYLNLVMAVFYSFFISEQSRAVVLEPEPGYNNSF